MSVLKCGEELTGEGDVAVPGGRHGLRRVVDVPTSDARRWRRSRSQHQPGIHALLVRTGGSLCPVQTESEQSSSRARACQSLISLYTLHFTTQSASTLAPLALRKHNKLLSYRALGLKNVNNV